MFLKIYQNIFILKKIKKNYFYYVWYTFILILHCIYQTCFYSKKTNKFNTKNTKKVTTKFLGILLQILFGIFL